MLPHVLSVFGLMIIIYCMAPKVIVDPQPSKVSDDVLIPSKDVKVISWNKAEKKLQDKIMGPESITHNPDTGEIYIGSPDGMLWKINKDMSDAKPIIRIGDYHPDCGMYYVGEICGRILGLKFLAPDKVIAIDAYNGVVLVDLTKITKTFLVRRTDVQSESKILFNSVDIATKGIMIYFTISSMRWDLRTYIYSYLENDSTGRVYSYNLKTRKLNIIATNIPFANGIALSPDEKSLFVCEIFSRRIRKIDLLNLTEKPKYWIENLPGFPDNIKRVPSENSYLVALLTLSSDGFYSYIHKRPVLAHIAAWFFPQWVLSLGKCYNGQVYKFNDKGEIITIINGTYLQKLFITEAYQVGNKILFGTLHEPYIPVIDTK